MKKISTNNAPLAIGPYSQAISIGDFIFTSGQIPINPKTQNVEATGIFEQAEQVFLNLKAILESGGSSLENVVKTTCYLKNMADFADFNEVYSKYFINKPARSCVEVSALPKCVLCEVEAVAFRSEV